MFLTSSGELLSCLSTMRCLVVVGFLVRMLGAWPDLPPCHKCVKRGDVRYDGDTSSRNDESIKTSERTVEHGMDKK